MPAIAAAICTYRRYDVLEKALQSVCEQTLPRSDFEILVVDNTPEAESGEGEALRQRYSTVTNLRYLFEREPGLSNARNVAVRETSSPRIAFLDDDAIACPEWLEQVLAGFDAFDRVGVVGGRILPIWEVPRPAWLGDALTGNVSVVDWGGSLRVAGADEWFAGANITFSRELLEAAGGFSTQLGRKGSGQVLLSNEENQILDYARRSGYLQVYNPAASVDHLVEEKRLQRGWFRRRAAWQATSDFLLDADAVERRLPGMMANLRDYLCSLPPLQRNIRGLFMETDDPGVFQWQLSAIYANTALCMAGFQGVEDV